MSARGKYLKLAVQEPVVFFLLLLGYLWIVYDPSLHYHSFSPVFLLTWQYLAEHLSYPGGLMAYVSGWLLQSFRVPLFGALVITALLVAHYAALRSLLSLLAPSARRELALIAPVLVILAAQADYDLPWFNVALCAAVATGSAALMARVANPNRRLLVFVVLAIPLYYLLGGAWLIAAASLLVVEVSKRRYVAGIVLVLCALSLPWLAARFVFAITYYDAYGFPLPFRESDVPLALSALVILAPTALFGVYVIGILRKLLKIMRRTAAASGANSQKTSPRSSQSHPSSAGGGRAGVRSRGFAWWLRPTAGYALALMATTSGVNTQGRLIAVIDRASDRRDWPQVLQAAGKLTRADKVAMLDVNRALCHESQLLDRMFHYPQERGFELWFEMSDRVEFSKLGKASEILFELGHLNRAERMAAESLEINGPQPEVLERLFLVNVAKGRPEAAKPFLNLLSRSCWHGRQALEYRRALATDSTLSAHPEVRAAKALSSSRDYVGMIPNNVLMQITLRENPGFRPAFDYLIAEYLLNGQIEKVAQNLDRLDALAITNIPTHLEEALLVFEKLRPGLPLDLRGRSIRPATRERYDRFNQACRACDPSSPQGEIALRRDFGDTYWFFFLFGRSGVVQPSVPGKSSRI